MASRWIVWEWKKDHSKFVQNYNCKWIANSSQVRRNSFDLKRDAVKALIEREQERLTNKGFI